MDFSEKGENDMLPQGIDVIATADFTGKGLRKLDRSEQCTFQSLILDTNEFSRLENVDTYGELYKLSAVENKLVRMYGVSRLVHLRVLNLARNSIVAIEGLRELVHLRWLNLSGNKIKAAEHLNSNTSLEYVDLTHNFIATLSDISNLNLLRILLLDYNNLKTMGSTSHSLPRSVVNLSVTNNSIADLNQVSILGSLTNLQQFSIANNPCVAMTGNAVGFDYRPFIINFCQNLKLLDGYVISSKESLKAEWLYSMGKGRHFQLGEHADLVDYLSNVCPLTNADSVMSLEDAKLTRILSKRRHHQQQLMEELSAMTSSAPVNYSSLQKPAEKPRTRSFLVDDDDDGDADAHRIVILSSQEAPSDVPEAGHDSDALELEASGMSLRADTQYVPVPETLLSPDIRPANDLMSMSCESVLPRWLQRSAIPRKASPGRPTNKRPSQTDSPILRRPTQVQRTQRSNRPVSLSPSCNRRPNSASSVETVRKRYEKSDESGTDSDVPLSQLTLVKGVVQHRLDSGKSKSSRRSKAEHVPTAAASVASPAIKTAEQTEEVPLHTRAVVLIQASWRGYSARKKESVAGNVRREIRVRRAEDHVQHLMGKLADTQRELDTEKKLRKLQMEAIRSLWNEVQHIQGSSTMTSITPAANVETKQSSTVHPDEAIPLMGNLATASKEDASKMIDHLAATCNVLQAQVQELQNALHVVSSEFLRRGPEAVNGPVVERAVDGDASQLLVNGFDPHSNTADHPLNESHNNGSGIDEGHDGH